MPNNTKHFYGNNSELNSKIITDRSQLKAPYSFILGKSGSGQAFNGEAISGSGMSFKSKSELVEASAKTYKGKM